MQTKHGFVKRDSAIPRARDMLGIELINMVSDVKGAVIEILSWSDGTPAGYYWENGRDFACGGAPNAFDLNNASESPPWPGEIHAALWLFGPSKVKYPQYVLTWLHAHMAENAIIYMSNELPWHGKIPQVQEFSLYNDEEIHAMLVRSGFTHIQQSEEGPYFRLWSAGKSTTVPPELFANVEMHLKNGDWVKAVDALGQLDDRLDSLSSVREYALLLAACYDLAGNTSRCYAALTEALRIDPLCGRALCGFGRWAALNDDLHGAMAFFTEALHQSPSLVAALEGRAAVNEKLDNLTAAYEDLLDASSFRPRDEELLNKVIRVGNCLGLEDEVASLMAMRTDMCIGWDAFEHNAITVSDAPTVQVVGG